MSTINPPTVGRRVWFRPKADNLPLGFTFNRGSNQPCDAGIAYVHSERVVSLSVFDHAGMAWNFTSVKFIHGDESFDPVEHYAEWMPYQKAQAAKAPVGVITSEAEVEALIASEYCTTLDQAFHQAPLHARLSVVTLYTLVMRNGFVANGFSSVIDSADFDAELGKRYARENAIRQVIGSEAYAARDALAHQKPALIPLPVVDVPQLAQKTGPATPAVHIAVPLEEPMTFGQALQCLKNGYAVKRTGWNGKGMWLALQRPDTHSKMSLPYIYMSTADGKLVPWLASQTDMLAEDWLVAE